MYTSLCEMAKWYLSTIFYPSEVLQTLPGSGEYKPKCARNAGDRHSPAYDAMGDRHSPPTRTWSAATMLFEKT